MEKFVAKGFLHLHDRASDRSAIPAKAVTILNMLVKPMANNKQTMTDEKDLFELFDYDFSTNTLKTTNIYKKKIKICNVDNAYAGLISLLDSPIIYKVFKHFITNVKLPSFHFYIYDHNSIDRIFNKENGCINFGVAVKLTPSNIEVSNPGNGHRQCIACNSSKNISFDYAKLEMVPSLIQIMVCIEMSTMDNTQTRTIRAGPIIINHTTPNMMVSSSRPSDKKRKNETKKEEKQNKVKFCRTQIGNMVGISLNEIPGLWMVLTKYNKEYKTPPQSSIGFSYNGIGVGIFDTSFYDRYGKQCNCKKNANNSNNSSNSNNSTNYNENESNGNNSPEFHLQIMKFGEILVQFYVNSNYFPKNEKITKISFETFHEMKKKIFLPYSNVIPIFDSLETSIANTNSIQPIPNSINYLHIPPNIPMYEQLLNGPYSNGYQPVRGSAIYPFYDKSKNNPYNDEPFYNNNNHNNGYLNHGSNNNINDIHGDILNPRQNMQIQPPTTIHPIPNSEISNNENGFENTQNPIKIKMNINPNGSLMHKTTMESDTNVSNENFQWQKSDNTSLWNNYENSMQLQSNNSNRMNYNNNSIDDGNIDNNINDMNCLNETTMSISSNFSEMNGNCNGYLDLLSIKSL